VVTLIQSNLHKTNTLYYELSVYQKRLVVPKASREMKQYCDLSKKFTYQMF